MSPNAEPDLATQVAELQELLAVRRESEVTALKALHRIAGVPFKLGSVLSAARVSERALAKMDNLELQRKTQQRKAQHALYKNAILRGDVVPPHVVGRIARQVLSKPASLDESPVHV